MESKRWNLLMFGGPWPELSEEEISEGWHWCPDWDGLLVGPGMPEQNGCQCNIPSDNH